MNIFEFLRKHYFLKLVLHLGGLALVYRYICFLRKKFINIGELQQRLRIETTSNIDSLRKQFQSSSDQSLVKLKLQVVAGIAQQEDQQLLQVKGHNPKLFAIKEPFQIRRRVPYFSIVDLQQDNTKAADKIYIHPSLSTNIHESVMDQYWYENHQKESKWQFIKHLKNLFTFKINYRGVAFGSPIYLLGDFIMNHENGIIRCYRTYEIGSKKSIMKHLERKRVAIFLGQLGLYFFGIILFFSFIRLHQYPKQTGKKVALQYAEISKGNDTFKCEKCKNNFIDLIFLPCGHFNFCQECGSDIDICPNCRQGVEEVVKIYKS